MEALLTTLHSLMAALVSPECADTFLVDHDFRDKECLSLTVSKGLGYGVVVGAAIVKVPQIVKILRAKSAKGVSLAAHLQELLVYSITLTRSLRMDLPISTWGEMVFITLQLLILVWLILSFNKQLTLALPIYAVWGALMYILLSGEYVTQENHALLQSACIPIAAFSRVTQIVTIIRNGCTGQLSSITSALNFAGATARVLTTLKEVDDAVTLASFGISATLNFLIVVMFFMYPQDTKKLKEKKTK